MGIDVGDAVFKFLGDSTNLDAQFDEVGPKAQAAFEPATEAAEEAGERMKGSMREARGEVALLGEEVGVRLPRHVQTFVAQLPGVGEAMTAAFSATAALFLVQALVEGTDKLNKWLAETFVYTENMKAMESATADHNRTMAGLTDLLDKAQAKIESLDGVQKSYTGTIEEQTKKLLAQTEAEFESTKAQANKVGWYEKMLGLLGGYGALEKKTYEDARQATIAQAQADMLADQAHIKKEADLAKARVAAEEVKKDAIDQLEREKEIALASSVTEEEKYNVTQEFEKRKLELVKSFAEQNKKEVADLNAQIEAQQQAHALKMSALVLQGLKALQQAQNTIIETTVADTPQAEIALTKIQQAMLKGADAAHSMGVSIRQDLVDALENAKAAELAFAQSGIVDKQAMEGLQKATADAQRALDSYGKSVDTFKVKSHGMWQEFQREAQSGAKAIDLTKQSGVQAFDDLSNNIGGAFQSIVLGQGNVVKALEQSTAASLAQIAAQAAVKALFYTAEGFAALAMGNGASAGNYFTAAAEMGAVAGAAGIAGRALSGAAGGGGGSSNTPQQLHSSVSDTTSQAAGNRGVSGIQGFATGALVTQPTLAMISEKPGLTEAVIPLNDPEAMSYIGAAVAKASGGAGGGHAVTVNVHGHVIGAHDLAHFTKQLNRAVTQGRVSLLASNTFRVTKRSA